MPTLRLDNKQAILEAFNTNMKILIDSTNAEIAQVTKNTTLPSITKKALIRSLQKQFRTRAKALKIQLKVDLAQSNTSTAATLPSAAPATLPSAAPTILPITATKHALLIGCNYTGSDFQLNGCINDIQNLKSRITTSYGFLEENITVLTDTTPVKPTKANIISALTTLLQAGSAGDTLLVQFSGHGSCTIDTSGDEFDGYDELIVPTDFHYISDDELKALLLAHLKKGVTLIALFDSCHSGTAMDLRFQYSPLTTVSTSKETVGQAILISGCKDSQTSADTFEDGQYQGAMTWAFLKATKPQKTLSWNDLIQSMRTSLAASNYTQVPQLSSGLALNLAAPIDFIVYS